MSNPFIQALESLLVDFLEHRASANTERHFEGLKELRKIYPSKIQASSM